MKQKLKLVLYSLTAVLLGAIFLFGALTPRADTDNANLVKISAKGAALYDFNSGKLLFAKNEKQHLPIASMVKIMTLTLIFDEIESGNLKLSDDIVVSANAASMGGSQAFLDANTPYNAGELIKTIVVASANDSCYAFAEHISGSVEAFVERMNERAKGLGANDTLFVNCTGLPAPNQYSCAHDVGLMMLQLIKNKQFFEYSNVWMFDMMHKNNRKTELSNTNKLLKAYNGCDGGKTGFTNDAGHCIAATALRGDTRFVSVIVGAPDSKTRFKESADLLTYGFSNYETRLVVEKDKPLSARASVINGKQTHTEAAPKDDLFYFCAKKSKPKLTYKEQYNKISAPVKAGDVIGTLTAFDDGQEIGSVDLVSLYSIAERGYMDIVDKLIEKF